MVRHVDYDSILLSELVHNCLHDTVVVKRGVVVFGKCRTLLVVQLRAQILVVVLVKLLLHLRAAALVVHMLSFQVEDYQLWLSFSLALQLLVVVEQSVVEAVERCVAGVKLCFAQHFVIEEESSAEVIHRLLGLRQELVCHECHMITCLSEHFGEERIVTPFAFVSHRV